MRLMSKNSTPSSASSTTILRSARGWHKTISRAGGRPGMRADHKGAKSVGPGNCGPSDAWTCQLFDSAGDVGQYNSIAVGGEGPTSMGIAIEEDDNGFPIIAYQDVPVPIGSAALKIARPYAAVDWNPNPNCGPIDLFYTWVCEMMEGGGASLDEADAVSLTVNTAGEALVAYRELDSYPFPAEGSIKVAYESAEIFSDGFESGNTSARSGVGE